MFFNVQIISDVTERAKLYYLEKFEHSEIIMSLIWNSLNKGWNDFLITP